MSCQTSAAPSDKAMTRHIRRKHNCDYRTPGFSCVVARYLTLASCRRGSVARNHD